MAATPTRTYLAFHFDNKLLEQETTITSITPFASLPDSSKALFKSSASDSDHIVICPSTVFHPQGGGQPSDIGTISTATSHFHVTAARTDASGQVLHAGHFEPADHDDETSFQPGASVTQRVDAAKRLLYSRLHTAGHVLGAAVRHLVEAEIDGFDELKASHFPDSAACEFKGAIEGKWKAPIQGRMDEYLASDMPVEIEFWDEAEFARRGLQRLVPDREAMGMLPGEKFRVVNIVGAEVYPCGGTHVDSTGLCGKTTVRKIARSKGVSRVSYAVE